MTELFASGDHTLLITEKLDGNNFRATLTDGDELQVGSRNCILGSDLAEIGGQFDAVTDHLSDRVDIDAWRDLEADWRGSLTIFGENAVEHTISEYDWSQVPQFSLFDVWIDPWADDETGSWLEWQQLCTVADTLDVHTVPVRERTTVDDFDAETFSVPESLYRPDDGPAEGVVIRNDETGARAKVISDEFAERHGSASSQSFDTRDDDTRELVHESVTDRRVDKAIDRLIDDPTTPWDSPAMEMMEELHYEVWFDVWSEDFEEIAFSDWTIDCGDGHSLAAQKTANRLKSRLQFDG